MTTQAELYESASLWFQSGDAMFRAGVKIRLFVLAFGKWDNETAYQNGLIQAVKDELGGVPLPDMPAVPTGPEG